MDTAIAPAVTDLLKGRPAIDDSALIGAGTRLGRNVIIEAGCVIGQNCIIGHNVVLRPETVIGPNSVIAHGCVCEGATTIGARVLIEPQCHLTKHMTIEDDVFFGTSVITTNTNRIVHGRNIELVLAGPHIGRAARIGSGAMIGPGVRIGENALIGLGAVVTKNVPPKQIWFGNPAAFKGFVAQKELL
jgi:acetyltransferase-like isoleucine patch superfamily enzyme